MKNSYKEIKILVWNFNDDVTTNFIQASGEQYQNGDGFADDDFE